MVQKNEPMNVKLFSQANFLVVQIQHVGYFSPLAEGGISISLHWGVSLLHQFLPLLADHTSGYGVLSVFLVRLVTSHSCLSASPILNFKLPLSYPIAMKITNSISCPSGKLRAWATGEWDRLDQRSAILCPLLDQNRQYVVEMVLIK